SAVLPLQPPGIKSEMRQPAGEKIKLRNDVLAHGRLPIPPSEAAASRDSRHCWLRGFDPHQRSEISLPQECLSRWSDPQAVRLRQINGCGRNKSTVHCNSKAERSWCHGQARSQTEHRADPFDPVVQ